MSRNIYIYMYMQWQTADSDSCKYKTIIERAWLPLMYLECTSLRTQSRMDSIRRLQCVCIGHTSLALQTNQAVPSQEVLPTCPKQSWGIALQQGSKQGPHPQPPALIAFLPTLGHVGSPNPASRDLCRQSPPFVLWSKWMSFAQMQAQGLHCPWAQIPYAWNLEGLRPHCLPKTVECSYKGSLSHIS